MAIFAPTIKRLIFISRQFATATSATKTTTRMTISPLMSSSSPQLSPPSPQILKTTSTTTSSSTPPHLVNSTLSSDTLSQNNTDDNNNKASPAQLAELADQLVLHLPKVFAASHPLSLYTRDVILIDNIRGVRTQGISQYHMQLSLFRIYHYLRYTGTSVELLNLVKNQEESCIKIRWRIITKPGLFQSILFFWKLNQMKDWKDGISTMHVNQNGKIFCHVCDKIDVETDDTKQKKAIKNPLINRGLNVNIKRTNVT